MSSPERDYIEQAPRRADPNKIAASAMASRALDRAASAIFDTVRDICNVPAAALQDIELAGVVTRLRRELATWTEAAQIYRALSGQAGEVGRASAPLERPSGVTETLLDEWLAELRRMSGSQLVMLGHAESFPPSALLPRIGDLPDQTRGEEVAFRRGYLRKLDARIATIEWIASQRPPDAREKTGAELLQDASHIAMPPGMPAPGAEE